MYVFFVEFPSIAGISRGGNFFVVGNFRELESFN